MSDPMFPVLQYGADYNPEQWRRTPEIWDEDMRMMKLAGINLVSIGIFSWPDLEPEEGQFDFSWLDTIMDKLAENGIRAALATPSAAPPPWMALRYPDIIRTESNGIHRRFGVRQNHCFTSPIYREKVAIINRELAKRYGHHPALALWHVSNEYSGECHCEQCQQAFRRWLRTTYHDSLDELNDSWWGSFWGHRYTGWEEIGSFSAIGENHISGHALDWKRFVSDQTIDFFENEIRPLRELTPEVPVTTNFMNTFGGLQYQTFAQHLDVAAWDNYPTWHDNGKDNSGVALQIAFIHDLYRSMRGGQPFLVMESTPSNVNWHRVNKLQRPGMLNLSALQGIAHGSDSMQFFQWRKGRGGCEKYHGAVVDHVGHENTRTFREVAALGGILKSLPEIAGTRRTAEVALIFDWDNRWGIDGAGGFNNAHRDYQEMCERYYAPFWKAGVGVDVVAEDVDFSPYRLVVAPMLYMLKPGVAERLTAFVEAGGTLVTTYFTGMVNEHDDCFLGGFPGDGLSKLLGVWTEETDALYEQDVQSVCYDGTSFPVQFICDLIHLQGAEVLGEYEHDFYAGTPAVTSHAYGRGMAYHVAFRDDGQFVAAWMKKLIDRLALRRAWDSAIPHGVSVQERGGFTFVLNFMEAPVTMTISVPRRDRLSGQQLSGDVTLPPLGAWVLEPSENS